MRKLNFFTVIMNKRIRNIVHFFDFCVLSMVLVFTLNSFNLNGQKSYIIALMFVFLYACTDELHQFFISGRDARFLDVIIDSTGGAFGLAIYAAVSELFVEIKEKLFTKTKM